MYIAFLYAMATDDVNIIAPIDTPMDNQPSQSEVMPYEMPTTTTDMNELTTQEDKLNNMNTNTTNIGLKITSKSNSKDNSNSNRLSNINRSNESMWSDDIKSSNNKEDNSIHLPAPNLVPYDNSKYDIPPSDIITMISRHASFKKPKKTILDSSVGDMYGDDISKEEIKNSVSIGMYIYVLLVSVYMLLRLMC
jgi:hypothetical protein